MRIGKNMTTYTGIQFYPLDPRKEEVATEDIGHALSLVCRANGHYRNFYSVAQHSLHCAQEAQVRGYSKRVQLACLLHDASEAYISDMTRPVKRELTKYLEIEEKLQGFIYTVYGLGDLTEEELHKVAEIDDAMLDYELVRLLDTKERYSGELIGQYDLGFKMMDEVEAAFITLVDMLQKSDNCAVSTSTSS